MTIQDAVARRNLERASDPGRALAVAAEAGQVAMTPILRTLGIDPSNPTHQAALLVADKYGLDPLLKHVIVIPNKGPYITRDGLLHAAHRSGQLDGIELVEQTEDETHWHARVSVWRKDMTRAFTYPGRYAKSAGNKLHGPEMAIARAESMALRRAFSITGLPSVDEVFDVDMLEPPMTVTTSLEQVPNDDRFRSEPTASGHEVAGTLDEIVDGDV